MQNEIITINSSDNLVIEAETLQHEI